MGLFSSPAPDAAVRAQLTRLERKLDMVLEHLGLETPQDDGLNQVRDLMAKGQKIEAIKIYREITGVGLAEAKSAVESDL